MTKIELDVDVQDEIGDPQEDVLPEYAATSVAHQFIHTPDDKPLAPIELSEEEKKRRELQRRYKRVFGYKPTTKNLDTLRAMVETAERRYN